VRAHLFAVAQGGEQRVVDLLQLWGQKQQRRLSTADAGNGPTALYQNSHGPKMPCESPAARRRQREGLTSLNRSDDPGGFAYTCSWQGRHHHQRGTAAAHSHTGSASPETTGRSPLRASKTRPYRSKTCDPPARHSTRKYSTHSKGEQTLGHCPPCEKERPSRVCTPTAGAGGTHSCMASGLAACSAGKSFM
jgi:hypothetical protein